MVSKKDRMCSLESQLQIFNNSSIISLESILLYISTSWFIYNNNIMTNMLCFSICRIKYAGFIEGNKPTGVGDLS